MSDTVSGRSGNNWNWPRTFAHTIWAASIFGSVVTAGLLQWSPVSIGGGEKASVSKADMPRIVEEEADVRRPVIEELPAQRPATAEAPEVKQLKSDFAELKTAVDGQAETNRQILGLLDQLAQAPAQGTPGNTSQQPAAASTVPGSLAANAPAASGMNAVEVKKEVVSQILSVFRGFDGVLDAAGKAKKEGAMIALFDPRCPYCHSAFSEMKGKIATYWVPTLALGREPNGYQMVQTILDGKDRLQTMDDVMNKRPVTMSSSTGKAEDLIPKIETEFGALLAGAGLEASVPVFIVPRPNGTAVVYSGYEPGQVNQMLAVMKGDI